jgi:hypothetical protein
METGVSLEGVTEASAFIAGRLDHQLPSKHFAAVQRS